MLKTRFADLRFCNGSESASRTLQVKKMKRFIMAMALALTVAAAPIATQPLKAEDAHHPKTQTKKVKKTKKKTSLMTPSAPIQASMMMSCPMMQAGQMPQAGMMSCPMMAAHDPGMMPSPQRMMMPGQHSMMMQMMHGQCWFETDRDRGYGYWGLCQH